MSPTGNWSATQALPHVMSGARRLGCERSDKTWPLALSALRLRLCSMRWRAWAELAVVVRTAPVIDSIGVRRSAAASTVSTAHNDRDYRGHYHRQKTELHIRSVPLGRPEGLDPRDDGTTKPFQLSG